MLVLETTEGWRPRNNNGATEKRSKNRARFLIQILRCFVAPLLFRFLRLLRFLKPTMTVPLRHDWTVPEIEDIYTAPLPDLIFRAQTVHRAHHRADEVQGCMLLSIKTGGCPEDCAYCPQSAHYQTDVTRSDLVSLDELTDGRDAARGSRARRGSAWARPGATCRTARRSSACSRWCASCAGSGWRRAARSACSATSRPTRSPPPA